MSKTASKRSGAAVGEDSKAAKQAKEDTAFTGTEFEDADGVSVYTDGACFFNGKKGQVAGIGVYWREEDEHNTSEVLPGTPSNHRAEIHAAVRAVQIAKTKGVKKLILHTDSQYLINSITKWIGGWKKREWKTSAGEPVKNKEEFEALDNEIADISIKWVVSKSKSGIAECDEADRLSKKGAGLKDKSEKEEAEKSEKGKDNGKGNGKKENSKK